MKLGAQDSDITIRKADAFFRSHFAPVWQKAPKVCKEAAMWADVTVSNFVTVAVPDCRSYFAKYRTQCWF